LVSFVGSDKARLMILYFWSSAGLYRSERAAVEA